MSWEDKENEILYEGDRVLSPSSAKVFNCWIQKSQNTLYKYFISLWYWCLILYFSINFIYLYLNVPFDSLVNGEIRWLKFGIKQYILI